MRQLFIAFFLSTLIFIPCFADYPECPNISVSGKAVIDVDPDEMHWSILVLTTDDDLTQAATLQDSRMRAILTSLKKLGIEDDKIRTSRVELNEKWTPKKSRPDGYRAEATIHFISEQLESYRQLWFELTQHDYVRINQVNFETSKRIETQNKARQQAVRAAKNKAAKMLRELDCEIGQPLIVSEHKQSFSSREMMSNTYLFDGVDSTGPTGNAIAPGTIEISMVVDVTFEILCKN